MKIRIGIRDVILFVHRWTGLATALFLVIVGLTGSLLAVREPINRLVNPSLYVDANGRQPLEMGILAERALAQEPSIKVWMFTVEPHQALFHVYVPADPVTGKFGNAGFDQLVLDPYTGRELGHYAMDNWSQWRPNIMNIVYDAHTTLVTRKPWAWVFLGYVALAWTIDTVLAFWLTLPRGKGPFWRRWAEAWGVKWSASPARITFDLHRALALWLWPLLFAFAWSGVMFGLPGVYEPTMHQIFGMPTMDDTINKFTLPKPLLNPPLGWHQAQLAGEKLMAEQARQHNITVQRPYGMAYIEQFGVYTYSVRTSMDFRGHGWDSGIWVDATDGRLRDLFLPRGENTGSTIRNLLWGIHFGDLRDWIAYRLFVVLFGFLLATLSITGVLIWARKRRARSAVRSRAATAAA